MTGSQCIMTWKWQGRNRSRSLSAITAFISSDWGKPQKSVRIVGAVAAIRMRHLLNTSERLYRLIHFARVHILYKIHFNIIPLSQNLFIPLRADSILWLYWPVGFVYPAVSTGLGRSADSCIRSSWFEAGVSSGHTLSRSLTRHLNTSHFHNSTLRAWFPWCKFRHNY